MLGCTSWQTPEAPLAQVSNNPFGAQAPLKAPTKAAFAPGNQEIAWRVDRVGRDLLAANPQLGLKPVFATVGTPQPEVFHKDDKMVIVTEGLVKECKSDAELAAVLSYELGRMVAERESLAPAEVRQPERLPPIDNQFGGAASLPGPDHTRLAELARYEKEQPKKSRPPARPDPEKIARTCLEKAKYKTEDLDAALPLIRTAERSTALENQFKGVMPQSSWTP